MTTSLLQVINLQTTHMCINFSYINVLTHSVPYVFLGNSQTLFEDYRPISVAVVLIMIMRYTFYIVSSGYGSTHAEILML